MESHLRKTLRSYLRGLSRFRSKLVWQTCGAIQVPWIPMVGPLKARVEAAERAYLSAEEAFYTLQNMVEQGVPLHAAIAEYKEKHSITPASPDVQSSAGRPLDLTCVNTNRRTMVVSQACRTPGPGKKAEQGPPAPVCAEPDGEDTWDMEDYWWDG